MKKFLKYLLVMALVLVQFIPVVDAATITINKAVKGQTYNAYKIFDVTKSGKNYAYSINSTKNDNTNPWFAIVNEYATKNPTQLTLNKVGTTTKYVVVPGEKFDAKAFADYLNANKGTIDEDASATATSTTVEITVAEAGYYFVDSSLGALCILHTATDKLVVEEKNAEPSIAKTASQATAGVGDTVNFTVTVTAGGSADTSYIVTDEMTEGLDLNTNSFEIKVKNVAVDASNYTITPNTTGEKDTFEIVFKEAYTAALAKDTEIVITYTAVVNEKAIIPSEVVNKVKLTYGNSSTTEITVRIPNYDFELVKTNEAKEELTGAKFRLYDAQGKEISLVKVEDYYRPAKAGETGVEIEAGRVMVKGLASGTYFLEETKAPEGYNQLTSRHEFEITNADLVDETAVNVVNTTGVILPSTGGIGTILFLAIGSVMVIGFGVLLVTKLRLTKMSI